MSPSLAGGGKNGASSSEPTVGPAVHRFDTGTPRSARYVPDATCAYFLKILSQKQVLASHRLQGRDQKKPSERKRQEAGGSNSWFPAVSAHRGFDDLAPAKSPPGMREEF